MKFSNEEENFVHILDSLTDSWNILEKIANSDSQNEAFYVCDIGQIVRKYDLWKSAYPRIQPYFDVKCNDSAAVLGVLSALGVGFMCATKNEIDQVLEIGVSAKNIIFNNSIKPASQIKHAEKSRIMKLTFDSASDLNKIKKFHPASELLISIKNHSINGQDENLKIGCGSTEEAIELLELAKALNLNVVGVNLLGESGSGEVEVFLKSMAIIREVFDYGTLLGFDFNILNIGGFLVNHDLNKDFNVVNDTLEAYFSKNIEIIATPSSYFVESAFKLACNIRSVRISNDSSSIQRIYYIDDGVYGSFKSSLYNKQMFLPHPLNHYEEPKMYSSSVWGPTCDSLDQIANNVMLPEMKIGEWIVFENMGSYTLPSANSLNGFPNPKVHIVSDEKSWILLKDLLPLMDSEFMMGNISRKLPLDKLDNFSLKMPLEDIIMENFIISFGSFEETD